MINIDQVKEKILEYIQNNGPSLPVKIAKAIEMEPVFASAIISELTDSHQIKTSKMKVGASHLYFIEGQEQQLESFAEEYFKNIEKKAYISLKQNKYLLDQEQEPAIRVALRSINDFATPFKYQEKIMWRYNFVPKDEIEKLLNLNKKENTETKEKENKSPEHNKSEAPKEYPLKTPETRESTQGESAPKGPEEEPQEEPQQKIQSKTLFIKPSFSSPFNKEQSPIPQESHNTTETASFSNEVKLFIQKKGITLIEKQEESRNEFIGIIQINSDLGKIKYLLIARNKKIINDQDIIVAHQKASQHKMPCYFLHKGKITKKSLETVEEYKNILKVESMD